MNDSGLMRQVATPLRWLILAFIQSYRYAGTPLKIALLGAQARCRFVPSCSAYALEAVQKRGPLTGTCLALKRVCRCHPWGGEGNDPVPTASAPAPR